MPAMVGPRAVVALLFVAPATAAAEGNCTTIDVDYMPADIAVSEACSNVVMHAYEDGDGPLELTGWVEDDAVTFVVTDRGSGISPRLQTGAAGLGLGLPLMAALSDEVEVRSPPGGPTEVRMTFRIRAPEQM